MFENQFEKILRIWKIPAYKDKVVYKDLTKGEFDKICVKTLAFLKDKYKEIFKKTYFGEDKFWWVDYWSSSQYYRNLELSRNAFLTMFNALVWN